MGNVKPGSSERLLHARLSTSGQVSFWGNTVHVLIMLIMMIYMLHIVIWQPHLLYRYLGQWLT